MYLTCTISFLTSTWVIGDFGSHLPVTTRSTFCATRISVSLPKFWEKNCFPHAKFHWNRTIGFWIGRKRLSIWRPSTVLNLFLFFFYFVMWLSSSSKSAVYQSSSKSLRYGGRCAGKLVSKPMFYNKLLVFSQYQRVTDRQTDRLANVAE